MVAFVKSSEWLIYSVHVPENGMYRATFRASSPWDDRQIWVWVDGILEAQVKVKNTGSFDSYEDVSADVALPVGNHYIKLEFEKDEQNLDFMSFERTGSIATCPLFGQGPTATATGTLTSTPTPGTRAPTIMINSPQDGTFVTPGNVTVDATVGGNFTIADKQGNASVPGEGHLHFYMDASSLPSDPTKPAIPPIRMRPGRISRGRRTCSRTSPPDSTPSQSSS